MQIWRRLPLLSIPAQEVKGQPTSVYLWQLFSISSSSPTNLERAFNFTDMLDWSAICRQLNFHHFPLLVNLGGLMPELSAACCWWLMGLISIILVRRKSPVIIHQCRLIFQGKISLEVDLIVQFLPIEFFHCLHFHCLQFVKSSEF